MKSVFASEAFDPKKYPLSDTIARPFLMDTYKLPTAIVNIIGEYGAIWSEAFSKEWYDVNALAQQIPSLQLNQYENRVRFALIDKIDHFQRNLHLALKMSEVKFPLGLFRPFSTHGSSHQFAFRLPVQFSEQICSLFKDLQNACTVLLERDFKHKFPRLHFTDDVAHNQTLIQQNYDNDAHSTNRQYFRIRHDPKNDYPIIRISDMQTGTDLYNYPMPLLLENDEKFTTKYIKYIQQKRLATNMSWNEIASLIPSDSTGLIKICLLGVNFLPLCQWNIRIELVSVTLTTVK